MGIQGPGARGQGSGMARAEGAALSPSRPSHRGPGARQAGFTLLEVLVAIAILGTTMVAVLQLHGSTVTLAAKAESMATAARLAKNRMIDLTKSGVPPVGTNDGAYEEPELSRFTWKEDVEETPFSTQLVKVYEISVEVAWGKGPDERVRIRTYRLK